MSLSDLPSLPDLEPRFLPPPGWRWHVFTNQQGRSIRFGFAAPPEPRGLVVALPGLGEFCEKYFETAHDVLDRGLAFCVLDWQGQGLSSRFLPNRQKRHSGGFGADIEDLNILVCDYLHSAVTPAPGKRLPAIMLAHSMGGNIGLRYLAAYPGFFDAAAFSAPMIRIRALRGMPKSFSRNLTGFLRHTMGRSYAFGATDWHPMHRPPPPLNTVSSDPERARVHNIWCLSDPRLQVGGVTFGWLHEANRSCAVLGGKGVLESIDIPCLVAVPGRDFLVDPMAARQAADRLPRGRLLDLPGCLHETLMERDVFRGAFLKAFDDLLKESTKDCTVGAGSSSGGHDGTFFAGQSPTE